MIRCLIVDDEPLAIRVLEHLLADVPDVEVVASCTRPVEAVALVRERAADLLFLDIEMPGLSGLDLVRSMVDPPLFIFTTAHREHALEGFELDAVDYLLKPVGLPRLLRALDKVRQHARGAPLPGPSASRELHVRADRRLLTIRADDLAWARSLGDYVVLHVARRPVTVRMTMAELEKRLEPFGFLRIHRSTIVNPDAVTSWSPREIAVGDRTLRVGRSYRAVVADRMRRVDR